MRHAIVAAAIATLGLLAGGCAKDEANHAHKHAKGADACAMCAGHQTATADGKCPSCGMAVSSMNGPARLDKQSQMQHTPATRSSAAIDACPKCPGTQTLTADGTCPMCGGRPM